MSFVPFSHLLWKYVDKKGAERGWIRSGGRNQLGYGVSRSYLGKIADSVVIQEVFFGFKRL